VRPRSAELDGHGRQVLGDVRQLGLRHINEVRSSRLYLVRGRLGEQEVRLLAEELFADAVAETYRIGPGLTERRDEAPAIEVHYRAGVMNPVALSALPAARRLLAARGAAAAGLEELQTGRRYEIVGAATPDELESIARRVLANDCVETVYLEGLGRHDPLPETFATPPVRDLTLRHVTLAGLDDAELARLAREAHLFLSVAEMAAIRDHFAERGRDPTDLELETLAQTWSEHCIHKTLKSEVVYRGPGFGRPGHVEVHFANLLKNTIAHATEQLARDWCLSVFVDNAGVIAFDDEYGIAFKVETHNHPSAIEPYGGAATGIGGCIRDIMGCGLGAKPIASTDVFCLGPPDFEAARLPKDVLHPRRIFHGVVAGVRDYGNRMGIPTVNGAVYFDERYLGNPLVFCGCVGLIPRERIHKSARTGDRIVVAGGRTGRDGIHGATFSSAELTDAHADEFSHAVQIGNAIEEKKVLDALLLARDHAEGCLYSAVTDCGAGGLSSAVGEMGRELSAVVDLDDVPLKYPGLRYDEIWISEAQERMVFAVPPEKLGTFLELCSREEVEATVIGTFTDDRQLRVRYGGQVVGELDMDFLHEGYPRAARRAVWRAPSASAGSLEDQRAFARAVGGSAVVNDRRAVPGGRPAAVTTRSAPGWCDCRLLEALSSFNIASKEWVIRQYDHEVQGRSVIKPLAGLGPGPADAAVLRPRLDSCRGIALAGGLCPELSDVDPYVMAVAAVDEALRNVICVGADPERTAILDNFCWGKVDTEEALGALVRACCGARDAALAYGLPFISGKDSLNNEYALNPDEARRLGLPERIVIPGTLLISALGTIADVRRCVSMDLKEPGDVLVLASAPVERFGLEAAAALHRRAAELIGSGQVRAAHDVSDGGLGVAVAEMCIAAGLGARLALLPGQYDGDLLERRHTSYVLEMKAEDARSAGLPVIGEVTGEARLNIARERTVLIDLTVAELAEAWHAPLAHGGGD